MFKKRVILFALTLLASAALHSPCLAASVSFSFNYSFSGEGDLVWAQGVLTADGSPGNYQVIDVVGIRNVNGTSETITGAITPGGFAGNSNILYYPDAPVLDGEGLSFSVLNQGVSGSVNVYFDEFYGVYWEALASESAAQGYGLFQVEPVVVPEPSIIWLLIPGSVCLAACHRQRSRDL